MQQKSSQNSHHPSHFNRRFRNICNVRLRHILPSIDSQAEIKIGAGSNVIARQTIDAHHSDDNWYIFEFGPVNLDRNY